MLATRTLAQELLSGMRERLSRHGHVRTVFKARSLDQGGVCKDIHISISQLLAHPHALHVWWPLCAIRVVTVLTERSLSRLPRAPWNLWCVATHQLSDQRVGSFAQTRVACCMLWSLVLCHRVTRVVSRFFVRLVTHIISFQGSIRNTAATSSTCLSTFVCVVSLYQTVMSRLVTQLNPSRLQDERGPCLRVGTLKERLGRAARSRITTLTSHGCAESEGHRWKDQRTRWRSPEDLWRLYQVISRRANEWSVFDCDPRAQDPKLTVGSALCKFYQNRQCKFGDECKFQHVSKGNETVRNRKGRGKGNTKWSDDTTSISGAAKGATNAGEGFDKQTVVNSVMRAQLRHSGRRCVPRHMQP